MRSVVVEKSVKIDRTDEQATEHLFESTLSDVAKLLWPRNTAATIAAELDCTVRAAELYLAGDRKWSGQAVAFIVAEILRRHSMRNVRVKAR